MVHAKRRAAFRRNLSLYAVVNLFLVAVWYFTTEHYELRNFWPVWPIAGWGIGLVFQYLGAYHTNNFPSAEKEYERLLRNRNSNQ